MHATNVLEVWHIRKFASLQTPHNGQPHNHNQNNNSRKRRY